MSDWIDAPVTDTVARLTDVPLAERNAIRAVAADKDTHRVLFDRLPALRQVETGGATPRREAIEGAARIACWNVERLRHIDAIEATLRTAQVDIALLSEVDKGMARSGNRDRVADLAGRLGHGYAYAVEFLELDPGDVDEKHIHAGETNRLGFHGAAILSDVAIRRPFLIRIEARGDWFDGSRQEPRVGGTIALGAIVRVAGVAVVMVSVHLESHCDPATRRGDTEHLLAVLDRIEPAAPVILGGDFNTSTASHAERHDRAAWRASLAADPNRLIRPQAREPLFEVLAARGYYWHACNVEDISTTRHSDPSRPSAKIDWFFTRGLVASSPEIIPALRPDGTPSSDHDCLVVSITPR